MYFIYILQCGDGTLYTGVTTDLQRRLQQHKAGTGGKYTRSRTIKRIAYSENASNRSNAQKREAEIKKLTRVKKLRLIAAKQKA